MEDYRTDVGRATLALPPHFTTGGCYQMCLPCQGTPLAKFDEGPL